MLNLLMTKDNSQPTDAGCVNNGMHNRLMQTDFSYYNVRKATEQNKAIKYLKVAIVTNFAHEWRLPNGGFADYDVSERLLQNMRVDEKFYKDHLREPWKNYYMEHENPYIKDDEFISILIEQALEGDEGYFGLIKQGRFDERDPFKPFKDGDYRTHTYIFGIAGEPGRDIPSAEWVKTKIENLYIAGLSGIKFEVYTKEASSSPYRSPKPKGNDNSDHFDSKGVLIEIGDTVVFPRGGEHNFYWCDFSKVIRFTPEYMEMENGQKAMCRKCIVVKTDKKKKLAFEE